MQRPQGTWFFLSLIVLLLGMMTYLSIQPSEARSAAAPFAKESSEPQTPLKLSKAKPVILAQKPSDSSPAVAGKVDPYQFLEMIPAGKTAPDFKAMAADQMPVQLSKFKGKHNLVLVFYQGSFCHLCADQLTNLQKHLDDFKKHDAQILAISADDRAHAEQTLGEHGLSFPVIPDPDKSIINKFGVANIAKKGIAYPSVYVVDKKGIVRLSFANPEGKRLHTSDLLPVLSKLTGRPYPKLSYEQ